MSRSSTSKTRVAPGGIAPPGAARAHVRGDRVELRERVLELVVHHDELVGLEPARDLVVRGREPPPDHVLRVGGAAAQPALQLRLVGREHEHGRRRVRPGRADLGATLDVDVEQRDAPRRERGVDRVTERAVAPGVDLRPLGEGALPDELGEALRRDEVVVHPVALVAARRARRGGDREHRVGVRRAEAVRERGLAGAGGRGEDEEQPGRGGGLTRHSAPARACARSRP